MIPQILMIMAIPLSQGLYALVDGEDYEELSKDKWSAHKDRNTFYAVRKTPTQKGKRQWIIMHREVLRLSKGIYTDHRNGNGLDNRKQNLRIATNAENQHNQKPQLGCVSKYKGAHWHKRDKKWQSQIRFNGKNVYLGYFKSEILAAEAYDQKARELFGEFAHTNF